jgi:DNA-binding MarR family transcriptional regulator
MVASDTSLQSLRSLELIFNDIRAIESNMPASYMAALVYVAQHERKHGQSPTPSDIADNLGMSRPTMSRIVRSLSNNRLGQNRVGEDRSKGGRKSLHLLERSNDAVDHRMVRVRLSQKGRGLIARLTTNVKG